MSHVMFQDQVSLLLPFVKTGICCETNYLSHCASILIHWAPKYMSVHSQVLTQNDWSACEQNPQQLFRVHYSKQENRKSNVFLPYHSSFWKYHIHRGHYHTKIYFSLVDHTYPPSPQIFVIMQHKSIPHCIYLNLEFLLNVQILLDLSVV